MIFIYINVFFITQLRILAASLLAAAAFVLFLTIMENNYMTSTGKWYFTTRQLVPFYPQPKPDLTVLTHPHPSTTHCESSSSVAFIKTHKTGSTTMSSIINRFGFIRNCSFLMFKGDAIKHGHFRNQIPKDAREILPPFGTKIPASEKKGKYDYLATHIRFLPNLKFLKLYMNPEVKYITMLRDPVDQWKSAFYFFGCMKKIKNTPPNASPMDTFLRKPAVYWKKFRSGTTCKSYTRNGMWYDLTANFSIHTDITLIKRKLRVLDAHLDLVLITEYLDESLILLKDMMGWDYRDILHIAKNTNANRTVVSKKQASRIRSWNMADCLLYDHYNKTLWRKIKEYGDDKFRKDLTYFRHLLNKTFITCDIKIASRKMGLLFKLTTKAGNKSSFCQNIVSSHFTSLIWQRQNTSIS